MIKLTNELPIAHRRLRETPPCKQFSLRGATLSRMGEERNVEAMSTHEESHDHAHTSESQASPAAHDHPEHHASETTAAKDSTKPDTGSPTVSDWTTKKPDTASPTVSDWTTKKPDVGSPTVSDWTVGNPDAQDAGTDTKG